MNRPARSESLRADAQRNREAVLAAAVRLLAERPTATMREIADASGLGRTTVYRHFATREELLRALFEQVVAEGYELAAAATASNGPALETLRGLGPGIVAIGERYRFLNMHRHLRDEAIRSLGRGSDPLEVYLLNAQERGELRADVPATLMLAIVRGLGLATIEELLAGDLPSEDAGRVLGDMFVRAFEPR